MTNADKRNERKGEICEIQNAISIDPSEPMFRFTNGQWLTRESLYENAIPTNAHRHR
jgi:hypothetical protein